jgi:hypothetical protein
LKEAVLLDRWNSDGEFVLKVNLFPEKVPKTFHKCSTKIISFINPPAVMEKSDKGYTGIEVNFVKLIFKKLNLTAEYNVSPNTKHNFYQMYVHIIEQLEPASSDIAIGVLPLHSGTIQVAEATIPYFHMKISWYVPCPKPTSRWKFLYKMLGTLVSTCINAAVILAIIVMWLLAKFETKPHVRESENYKKIVYCVSNVFAVFNGVSVPQKPVTLSLRIFFIAWVWYSFAVTNLYQGYIVGILVNPEFEKSITTINDLIQSGIEYGYLEEMDTFLFSDPAYNIITKNREACNSGYKCLQRVIERKDFATIASKFGAEYFRSRLLFYNIHVQFCTLQEDVISFRISMYMAKGNPLLHRFNDIITRMFEAGLFEKWQDDFISRPRLDDHPIDDDDTKFSDFTTNEINTVYTPFSVIQLQVMFYILPIGQIISSFVLLVEVLYYRACIPAATSTTLYRAQRDH